MELLVKHEAVDQMCTVVKLKVTVRGTCVK